MHGNSLAVAIMRMLEIRGKYEGTIGKLHEALESDKPRYDKFFPPTSAHLSKSLKRLRPALEKIGIIVDDMAVPKYYLDFINQISGDHSHFFDPVIINQNINIAENNRIGLFSKLIKKIYKDGLASLLHTLVSRIVVFIESKALSKQET